MQHEEQLGGNGARDTAHSTAEAGSHEGAQEVAALPPVKEPSWAWGHNCPLSAEDAKRAALELVQKMGAGKKDIPDDLFDFMKRADVIYLDENNQPVTFKRVIIAWEDR